MTNVRFTFAVLFLTLLGGCKGLVDVDVQTPDLGLGLGDGGIADIVDELKNPESPYADLIQDYLDSQQYNDPYPQPEYNDPHDSPLDEDQYPPPYDDDVDTMAVNTCIDQDQDGWCDAYDNCIEGFEQCGTAPNTPDLPPDITEEVPGTEEAPTVEQMPTPPAKVTTHFTTNCLDAVSEEGEVKVPIENYTAVGCVEFSLPEGVESAYIRALPLWLTMDSTHENANISCRLDVPMVDDGAYHQILATRYESGKLELAPFMAVSQDTSWTVECAAFMQDAGDTFSVDLESPEDVTPDAYEDAIFSRSASDDVDGLLEAIPGTRNQGESPDTNIVTAMIVPRVWVSSGGSASIYLGLAESDQQIGQLNVWSYGGESTVTTVIARLTPNRKDFLIAAAVDSEFAVYAYDNNGFRKPLPSTVTIECTLDPTIDGCLLTYAIAAYVPEGDATSLWFRAHLGVPQDGDRLAIDILSVTTDEPTQGDIDEPFSSVMVY